jgi:hypothetical protein
MESSESRREEIIQRDFLMKLRNHPQSKKKPENLTDLEVVLKNVQVG